MNFVRFVLEISRMRFVHMKIQEHRLEAMQFITNYIICTQTARKLQWIWRVASFLSDSK